MVKFFAVLMLAICFTSSREARVTEVPVKNCWERIEGAETDKAASAIKALMAMRELLLSASNLNRGLVQIKKGIQDRASGNHKFLAESLPWSKSNLINRSQLRKV